MNQVVNPAMIVLARESRGLTQNDLAKQLQVTQGKISKIESGLLGVSEGMLNDLIRILKYPRKFFYQTFQVYPPGIHFYRKYKSLPAKFQSSIAATMNVRRIHIKLLLDAAAIDFRPVPECNIEEYGSPEAVARAVRQYLHMPRGPVKSMISLVEDMGIVVIPLDVGTRMYSGTSMITEKPNYLIFVNSNMPGDRCRYTLAHELGHIVMHRLLTENSEDEADRFASEFLMPEQDIRHSLSKLSLAELAGLKKYWKVSMAAVLKRATTLGKITERQYRSLWTEMGKAGYRLNEPPELAIPQEQPTLLQELIELHTKELGYNNKDLSDKIICDEDEFISIYRPSTRPIKIVKKFGT